MTSSSIRHAGIAMVAVTIASRGFGFLRETVIAHAFGASREVDLFLLSLTIPAILITTVYYSIPNALVPLWSAGSSHARQDLRIPLGLVGGSLVVTAALWGLAEPTINLLAPGFDGELQRRAASILRFGTAAIVFAVIEALLRSRLLAAKRFTLTGLSYLWQSLGIIAAATWWRDHGAMGLMWGLVIGTALSATWNFVLLISSRNSISSRPEGVPSGDSSGRAWMWVMLVLLTDSLAQVNAVVDRTLGSFLEPGAIAALNYANLTAGLPASIIGLALSTAILPFLSEANADKDIDRSRFIIDRAIRWALLLAIPVTIWLVAFRTEISALLFHRGAFDARALTMTAEALSAAAVGIIPISVAAVWSRLFYASRSWIPIAVTAAVALLSKTGLSIVLVPVLGATGLALATSGAYLVAALLTGYIQRARIVLYARSWLSLAVKTILLVGLPAVAGHVAMTTLIPNDLILRTIVAGGVIVAGVILLVTIGRRWGILQMADLVNVLFARG